MNYLCVKHGNHLLTIQVRENANPLCLEGEFLSPLPDGLLPGMLVAVVGPGIRAALYLLDGAHFRSNGPYEWLHVR